MGKQKMIYLSDDIHKLLSKEQNASNLVEGLLRQYFNTTKIELMSEEELKKFIALKELEKDYNTKLEEINNG